MAKNWGSKADEEQDNSKKGAFCELLEAQIGDLVQLTGFNIFLIFFSHLTEFFFNSYTKYKNVFPPRFVMPVKLSLNYVCLDTYEMFIFFWQVAVWIFFF